MLNAHDISDRHSKSHQEKVPIQFTDISAIQTETPNQL